LQGRFDQDSPLTLGILADCHHPLIAINHYGERLIGCIQCNRWGRLGDATLPMQLLEDGQKNRSGVAEAYSG
jgi:hypothetical protein